MRAKGLRLVGTLGVTALLFGIGAAGASAAGVNSRESLQRHSIGAGVHDGSLTRREARGLVHQQARTERLEQRFRADDGRLGSRERAKLDRRLHRNNQAIYRARHNDRTRSE